MAKNMFRTVFFFITQRIYLTDACLLIFMTILMFQSVYNLFFHELAGGSGGGTIDVVVRTTTAAIFGYFIGAGFLREDSIERKKKLDLPPVVSRSPAGENSVSPENSFAVRQAQPVFVSGEGSQIDVMKKRSKLQIIIVAAIGIFSLTVLVITNNSVSELPDASIATLSQLRDFVSGSVGLLIGNSARGKA